MSESAVMHGLVGADRNDARDLRQGFVIAGGKRLLDQLHAGRLPRL